MFGKGYQRLHDTESTECVCEKPLHAQSTNLNVYRILSVALLVSNILFAGLLFRASTQRDTRPRLVYSPSEGHVSYEKKRLWRDIDNNVYAGEPRKEHDEAWDRLIEPIAIKISESELDKINGTSIALLDGSGYIAETAVYHELHCIKRIRRHLYLDHYYPNMTEDQRLREGPHIDHCLEYWREAAMCRGDTTLSTFQWAEGRPFSHVYSDHQCVNWDSLDTWARSRMVRMSDLSILEQPTIKS